MSNKKILKVSAFLLAVILMCASCGNEAVSEITSNPETTVSETTAHETEPNPLDSLEKVDFEGMEYNILCAAEQWQNKYTVEELTGDVLDDVVYQRNLNIEQMYNIALNYDVVNGYSAGISTVVNKLQGSVIAGDMTYDLSISNSAYITKSILGGLFMNLYDSKHLNFDSEWYYKYVNSEMIVKDKLYAVAGSYGLQTIASCWAIFFNKGLAADLSLPSIYDAVNNGKWTFDKMCEYGKAASADLNGDGVFDKNDRYGIIGTATEPEYALLYGMGRTITVIGSDGLPKLTGDSEHTISVIEKLGVLLNDSELLFETKEIAPIKELIPMFCANQGLFAAYPLDFTEYAEIRESEVDFGILPMPKYNEEQDMYLTLCWADMCAVPTLVKNIDMSEIVMDALNCISYVDVYPMYKSVVLQNKLIRDDESSVMIDILNAGVTLDFGTIFRSQISDNLFAVGDKARNNNYVSFWGSIEESANKGLNNVIKQLDELQ